MFGLAFRLLHQANKRSFLHFFVDVGLRSSSLKQFPGFPNPLGQRRKPAPWKAGQGELSIMTFPLSPPIVQFR